MKSLTISFITFSALLLVIISFMPSTTEALIPGPEVCHACNATIVELKLKIPKYLRRERNNRQIAVVSSLEGICDMDNFKVYDYAPPKMIHACEDILGEFEEDLETLLINDDPEIYQKFCHDITKSCEFNPEDIKPTKPTMMVDGRPMEMETGPGSQENEDNKKDEL